MQSKTNTLRIEPYEYVPPVAAENFLPALTLVHSREPQRLEIEPYRPVSRLARSVIIVLAVATSLATMSGAVALIVL